MMKMSIAVMIALLMLGCSQKAEPDFITCKAYDFQKAEQPKARLIRVHKDDEKLYKAYIAQLRGTIDFGNKQIDDYYIDFNETGGATK